MLSVISPSPFFTFIYNVSQIIIKNRTIFCNTVLLCVQAAGADGVFGGQRRRSRHRADAVHQRGLLQTQEAATRSDPARKKTQNLLKFVFFPAIFISFLYHALFQKPS